MGFFDKLKISSIKQEVTKELLSAKQEVVQKFSDTTQKAEQQISSMINPVQKSRSISSAPKNYDLPKRTGKTLTSTKSSQPMSPYLEAVNKCKRYNLDTLIVFSSKQCPYCSKYGRRRNGKGKIYSISGKKKYPSVKTIPINLTGGICPECGCRISFDPYFEGINT